MTPALSRPGLHAERLSALRWADTDQCEDWRVRQLAHQAGLPASRKIRQMDEVGNKMAPHCIAAFRSPFSNVAHNCFWVVANRVEGRA